MTVVVCLMPLDAWRCHSPRCGTKEEDQGLDKQRMH